MDNQKYMERDNQGRFVSRTTPIKNTIVIRTRRKMKLIPYYDKRILEFTHELEIYPRMMTANEDQELIFEQLWIKCKDRLPEYTWFDRKESRITIKIKRVDVEAANQAFADARLKIVADISAARAKIAEVRAWEKLVIPNIEV